MWTKQQNLPLQYFGLSTDKDILSKGVFGMSPIGALRFFWLALMGWSFVTFYDDGLVFVKQIIED